MAQLRARRNLVCERKEKSRISVAAQTEASNAAERPARDKRLRGADRNYDLSRTH